MKKEVYLICKELMRKIDNYKSQSGELQKLVCDIQDGESVECLISGIMMHACNLHFSTDKTLTLLEDRQQLVQTEIKNLESEFDSLGGQV